MERGGVLMLISMFLQPVNLAVYGLQAGKKYGGYPWKLRKNRR